MAFLIYRLLIENIVANIDGALRVHDQSTWPENQKLFVFCSEPPVFEMIGAPCSDMGTTAYE